MFYYLVDYSTETRAEVGPHLGQRCCLQDFSVRSLYLSMDVIVLILHLLENITFTTGKYYIYNRQHLWVDTVSA